MISNIFILRITAPTRIWTKKGRKTPSRDIWDAHIDSFAAMIGGILATFQIGGILRAPRQRTIQGMGEVAITCGGL
jgi:hypothetical protein